MSDTSWIKRRKDKEKPKSWITKKEKRKFDDLKKKPTEWIKRKFPTDLRKRLVDKLSGGVKGKPHSSPEGRAASAGRTIKRLSQAQQKRYETNRTKPLGKPPKYIPASGNRMVKNPRSYAKGGRAGKQFGGRTNLLEELGRVEGEPSNRNRRAEISRVHGELNRGYAKGGRAGYGLGSFVKGVGKIIKKVTEPKGVFKPKPKKVTDKPTGWSPKGSYTKADEKKIDSMLYKLGDEIKAQPLPPKLKKTIKKLQKAYPHKKASGGRIGLRHGGSAGAAKRGHGAEIK